MRDRHFTVDGSGLTVRVDNGIVSLTGELDLASCATLRSAFDRSEPGDLIVDLAHLTFLDAAGIGCFVAEVNRRRQDRHRVTLRRAAPSVRRLLDLVGLTEWTTVANARRHRPWAGSVASARTVGRVLRLAVMLPVLRTRFGGVSPALSRAVAALHREPPHHSSPWESS